jgi:hypothetical protein
MVKRERDILWHRIPCTCVPALLRRQRQTAAVCFRGSSLDGWEYFLVDQARIYLLSICFPGAPNENDHQEQKWLLQRVSSFRFRFVLWSTRILPLE